MLQFLLPAAASVIGGLLSNKSKEKAQQQQSEQEYARQKEFAQMGIQWKTQDAEKAGIHPLYAMGAQTSSYAPQSVGGGQDFSFLSDAGQNIGRAIDSTRDNPAKELAMASSKIQLEGLQLDNELKRAQLASAIALTRQSSNPGLPSLLTEPDVTGMLGQGDAPQLDRHQPPQLTSSIREHGKRLPINPNWSDAQTIQDRYGDTIEEIAGANNWLMDKFYQRQKHFDKNVRPFIKLNPRRQYGGHRR